jgi:membrane-associated phospholipid phosphatase
MAIGFAAAFAGIMAISRTYLSAHWLTDTLAGACIGTGLALVWPAALEMAREHYWRQKAGPDAAAIAHDPRYEVVEEVL